jgi:hypothetical protein
MRESKNLKSENQKIKIFVATKHLLIFYCVFFFSNQLTAQKDSSSMQIEVEGAVYKIYGNFFLQYGLGLNKPAKKQGWYNSVSLVGITRDQSLRYGAITHFNTLSIGKNYQFTRKQFHLKIGAEAGLFYQDYVVKLNSQTTASIKTGGLSIVPRLEMGLNLKKTRFVAGFYFASGAGYRRKYFNSTLFADGIYIPFVGSPYLKIIFK